MKYGVYAIYDRKAGAYMQPFFSPANGMAIRAFSDVVNDPQHICGKHPQDFTLSTIGFYDDVNGKLMEQVPTELVTALDLVKRLEMDLTKISPSDIEAARVSINGEDR